MKQLSTLGGLLLVLLGTSCSLLGTTLKAEELTLIQQQGKTKYDHFCAPCHDPGQGSDGTPLKPAPSALTIKYQGALSPYITERSDLANADVLRVWVRGGTVSMPPFRPSEVTDDEIVAIAAYFSTSSK